MGGKSCRLMLIEWKSVANERLIRRISRLHICMKDQKGPQKRKSVATTPVGQLVVGFKYYRAP
jgi:hypothetical protein